MNSINNTPYPDWTITRFKGDISYPSDSSDEDTIKSDDDITKSDPPDVEIADPKKPIDSYLEEKKNEKKPSEPKNKARREANKDAFKELKKLRQEDTEANENLSKSVKNILSELIKSPACRALNGEEKGQLIRKVLSAQAMVEIVAETTKILSNIDRISTAIGMSISNYDSITDWTEPDNSNQTSNPSTFVLINLMESLGWNSTASDNGNQTSNPSTCVLINLMESLGWNSIANEYLTPLLESIGGILAIFRLCSYLSNDCERVLTYDQQLLINLDKNLKALKSHIDDQFERLQRGFDQNIHRIEERMIGNHSESMIMDNQTHKMLEELESSLASQIDEKADNSVTRAIEFRGEKIKKNLIDLSSRPSDSVIRLYEKYRITIHQDINHGYHKERGSDGKKSVINLHISASRLRKNAEMFTGPIALKLGYLKKVPSLYLFDFLVKFCLKISTEHPDKNASNILLNSFKDVFLEDCQILLSICDPNTFTKKFYSILTEQIEFLRKYHERINKMNGERNRALDEAIHNNIENFETHPKPTRVGSLKFRMGHLFSVERIGDTFKTRVSSGGAAFVNYGLSFLGANAALVGTTLIVSICPPAAPLMIPAGMSLGLGSAYLSNNVILEAMERASIPSALNSLTLQDIFNCEKISLPENVRFITFKVSMDAGRLYTHDVIGKLVKSMFVTEQLRAISWGRKKWRNPTSTKPESPFPFFHTRPSGFDVGGSDSTYKAAKKKQNFSLKILLKNNKMPLKRPSKNFPSLITIEDVRGLSRTAHTVDPLKYDQKVSILTAQYESWIQKIKTKDQIEESSLFYEICQSAKIIPSSSKGLPPLALPKTLIAEIEKLIEPEMKILAKANLGYLEPSYSFLKNQSNYTLEIIYRFRNKMVDDSDRNKRDDDLTRTLVELDGKMFAEFVIATIDKNTVEAFAIPRNNKDAAEPTPNLIEFLIQVMYSRCVLLSIPGDQTISLKDKWLAPAERPFPGFFQLWERSPTNPISFDSRNYSEPLSYQAMEYAQGGLIRPKKLFEAQHRRKTEVPAYFVVLIESTRTKLEVEKRPLMENYHLTWAYCTMISQIDDEYLNNLLIDHLGIRNPVCFDQLYEHFDKKAFTNENFERRIKLFHSFLSLRHTNYVSRLHLMMNKITFPFPTQEKPSELRPTAHIHSKPSSTSSETSSAVIRQLSVSTPSSSKLSPTHSNEEDRFIRENAFNQSNNREYYYQALDILTIQSVLFASSTESFHILPPIDSRYLNDFRKNILKAIETKHCLGSYNKGGNHWIAFALVKVDQRVTVFYKDSFGLQPDQQFLEGLTNIFRSSFTVKFVHNKAQEQNDGTSCGIFALENMRIIRDQLQSSSKEEFIEKFQLWGDFCNQTDADLLRCETFAHEYVRGIVKQLNHEKIKAQILTIIRNHHQDELYKLKSLLSAANTAEIRIIEPNEQFQRDTFQNTIGIEISTQLGECGYSYNYYYRLNYSTDLPEENSFLNLPPNCTAVICNEKISPSQLEEMYKLEPQVDISEIIDCLNIDSQEAMRGEVRQILNL